MIYISSTTAAILLKRHVPFPNVTYNTVPQITAGHTSEWYKKAPFYEAKFLIITYV